jgi:hypothetical protein
VHHHHKDIDDTHSNQAYSHLLLRDDFSILDLTVFPRGVDVKVQIEGNKDHLKNKFNSILKAVGILEATDRTTFFSDF